MKKLANLLLVLLPVSGLLSLTTALSSDSVTGALAPVGGVIAVLTLLLGILLLACLAFDQNLPKGLLLPQLFLLFWSNSGLWPLSGLLGQQPAEVGVAALRLLLGLLVLLRIRTITGTSLLLTPAMFSSPGFHLGNFFRVVTGGLLLIPLALLFFGFSLAASHVERLSGGFVRLAVDGLYMTERTYDLNDKTVRLTSMIHIGDGIYYRDLVEAFTPERTLVLVEGVTDRQGLLRQAFSYGKIADLLGLDSQESMQLPGRWIDVEQFSRHDLVGAAHGQPDLLRADVDVRDFDARTVEFIDALGTFLASESLTAGYQEFNRWAGSHLTPELNDIIMEDLVARRNLVVVGYLEQALDSYGTIVIPWGALHMRGLEEAVLSRGFRLATASERRSIPFSTIPFARLFARLGDGAAGPR